jgi:ATP-dependent DNA helicase RecQ
LVNRPHDSAALQRFNLVEVAPGKFATLQVTAAGRMALRERTPTTLTKQVEKPPAKVKRRAGEIECDEASSPTFAGVRRTLADARNVPAYVIFSDVALREMARTYPTTPVEFRRIPGAGEQKLRTFAEPFLAVISEYVREHGRQVDLETAGSAAAD